MDRSIINLTRLDTIAVFVAHGLSEEYVLMCFNLTLEEWLYVDARANEILRGM